MDNSAVEWTEMKLVVRASSNQRTGAWQDRRLQEQEAHDRLSAAMQQSASDIPITLDLTTNDILMAGGILATRLKDGLKRWNVQETRYYNQGGVELVGSLDLHSWLSPVLADMAQAPLPSLEDIDHSGLLIDARGLDFDPSMSPNIVTLDGTTYMDAYTSAADTVLTVTPVGYVTDPASAATIRRIGELPVFVRALSVNGDGQLLLPSSQSPQLTHHHEFPALIAAGKVVIVIDS